MPYKNQNTDRSHGGPGSSHQDANGSDPRNITPAGQGVSGGAGRSRFTSKVSGGGGEIDRHHTHHPEDRS